MRQATRRRRCCMAQSSRAAAPAPVPASNPQLVKIGGLASQIEQLCCAQAHAELGGHGLGGKVRGRGCMWAEGEKGKWCRMERLSRIGAAEAEQPPPSSLPEQFRHSSPDVPRSMDSDATSP